MTIGLSVSVLAEPNSAFTHVDQADGKVVSVMSAELYTSSMLITAESLGIDENVPDINDICCGPDGKVYMLVGISSKIIVLNEDYTFNTYMSFVDENGDGLFFDNPSGIYVDNDSNIYVCDTYNSRVLCADSTGKVFKTWGTPESNLIPADFLFQPTRIVKDSRGYVYILSLGNYYGALAYSPDGEFNGFYGANNVKATALDTLAFIWDKLTKNDAKKSSSIKTLPFAFVDLALDSKEYMITCTGKTEADTNGSGQIRKLSPGGQDILYKRDTRGSSSTSGSVNFLESKVIKKYGVSKPQNIISIDVTKDDYIYALDSMHGLIYIYDNECNMIGGFGGGYDRAKQLGIFDAARALSIHGDDVLVLDFDNKAITVFTRTEYGKLLMEAQKYHLKGEYDKAYPIWQKVIKMNANCQLAYRGMAIACYTNGEYEKALEYAKIGLDYTTYDLAWGVLFSKYISDNFVWIFSIALVVIIGLVAFVIVKKKKGIILIKNKKLKLAFATISHPFNSFEEIRYKNLGSLWIAFVLLILYYLANLLNQTVSGFLFLRSDPRTYNTVYTILSTAGLIVLWSFANWLVACLSTGKGKLKDVFIATCYCTIPMTVYTFVRVILSQFLSISGLQVMDGIGSAVTIFTLFILCIAIMQVHEFDFFKFLSTTVVTILLMILIVSVVLLVGVLLQQVWEFILKLYNEAVFR
ncbi:MAG: YIP1 family protein [Clostridia bacterium]|nr:YIP1 family protein [Clostridia bacterium]